LILPHSFLPEEQPAPAVPPALDSFFSAHSPVLISVGLLEPEYDLPLQIEALRNVREKFPLAGLVLIGSGSLDKELRGKIGACPYADQILLCGDVPHAVTLQAISRAQLMLRTTLYDGDAVSVREALHLGTPVIASDNGMRPAGVQLIPKSNLDALVQAIENSISQPASRKTACSRDASNLLAVLDFYRELTGGKQP
jgi:glycosyltransferase involved in cell wall biosynthesis